MVTPTQLFFPTDPSMLAGMVDPQKLLAVAAQFPGGVVGLVFALFWAPVGPGIPAGVLLAHQAGFNPAFTFGLYTLSDVLGSLVCHPIYTGLRRWAGRVPGASRLGRLMVRFALLGTSPPTAEEVGAGPRGQLPVLIRIGAVGFGADVYSAGLLVVGLPIGRVAGWASAIVGDLIWFALLLATSTAAAQVTDRPWIQLVVMVAVMWFAPRLVKKWLPTPQPAVAAQPAAVVAEVERA